MPPAPGQGCSIVAHALLRAASPLVGTPAGERGSPPPGHAYSLKGCAEPPVFLTHRRYINPDGHRIQPGQWTIRLKTRDLTAASHRPGGRLQAGRARSWTLLGAILCRAHRWGFARVGATGSAGGRICPDGDIAIDQSISPTRFGGRMVGPRFLSGDAARLRAPRNWRTRAGSNRRPSALEDRCPILWTTRPIGGSGRARTDPGRIKSPVPRHLGIAPAELGAGPENRTQLCWFVGPVSATSGVARHGSGGRIRTCASPG